MRSCWSLCTCSVLRAHSKPQLSLRTKLILIQIMVASRQEIFYRLNWALGALLTSAAAPNLWSSVGRRGGGSDTRPLLSSLAHRPLFSSLSVCVLPRTDHWTLRSADIVTLKGRHLYNSTRQNQEIHFRIMSKIKKQRNVEDKKAEKYYLLVISGLRAPLGRASLLSSLLTGLSSKLSLLYPWSFFTLIWKFSLSLPL